MLGHTLITTSMGSQRVPSKSKEEYDAERPNQFMRPTMQFRYLSSVSPYREDIGIQGYILQQAWEDDVHRIVQWRNILIEGE